MYLWLQDDCWTDVETDCDGFLSYDRILKVPVEPMRAANALLTGDQSPPSAGWEQETL